MGERERKREGTEESGVHVGGRGEEELAEKREAWKKIRLSATHVDQHVLLGDTWSYTLLLYMGPYSPTHTVVRVILSLHAPTPSSSQSFELLPSPSPFYHTLAHYPTPTLLHSSLLTLNYNIFLDQLLSIF